MARTAPCPKCGMSLDLTTADASGRIVCPGCGATIKVKRANAAKGSAAPPRPQDPDHGPAIPRVEAGLSPLGDAWDPAGGPLADVGSQDPLEADPLGQPLPATALPSPARSRTPMRDAHPQAIPAAGRGWVILALCSGAGVAGLLAVGLLAWRFAAPGTADSRPNESDSVAPAASGILGETPLAGGEVTLDAPLGDIPPATPAAPLAALLQPAKPYDESRDSSAGSASAPPRTEADLRRAHLLKLFGSGRAEPSQPTRDTAPSNDGPPWQAKADPPPAETTWTIAPDLKLAVRTLPYEVFNSQFPFLPVLADLNGPFAVIPAFWEKLPYEVKSVPGGGPNPGLQITETPQAPIAVIDLRTGKPAGVFDWRVPFWADIALAPDGRHVVAPYHVPLARLTSLLDQAEEALAALYIWERDSSTPPKRLPLSGSVLWYGFTGTGTVATLIHSQSKQQLQTWDVATGQPRSSLELPHPQGPPPTGPFDRARAIQLDARPCRVAVSPGGRLLAVPGKEQLLLVSLAEQRIVGTVPAPATPAPFLSVAFSPAGDEIWLTYALVAAQGTGLIVLEAATGRRRCQHEFDCRPAGPLVPLAQDAFVLAGIQGAGQSVHFRTEDPRGRPFLGFEKLLRLPATGPVLVASRIDQVTKERSIQAIDRSVFDAEIAPVNPYGTSGKPQLITFDAGGAQVVPSTPPASSQCLPPWAGSPSPACQALPYAPWQGRWGAHLGFLIEESRLEFVGRAGKRHAVTASWVKLDAATGAFLGKPVCVRRWDAEADLVVPGQFAFGMAADGKRFVLGDPEDQGRLDVCDGEGMRRWGFHPFGPGQSVAWADFDAEGRLLVCGQGEIAAIEIGADSAKVLYRTSGGRYTAPFHLLPDRKLLAVSRGKSWDVVDVATGRCRNRCGIDASGIIADLVLAPDGKRAAALYVDQRDWAQLVQHRELVNEQAKAVVAVWELASGQALQRNVNLAGFGLLAWVGPDHLCVCQRTAAEVWDLRLGAHVWSYQPEIARLDTGFGLGRSPDGRLWLWDRAEWERHRQAAGAPAANPALWKAIKPTGSWIEQKFPFFADDRKLISLKQQPIRLEMDFGRESWSKLHGERVLAALQNRGYTIGRAGFVLRVRPRTIPTTNLLLFHKPGAKLGDAPAKVSIPRVEYVWEMLDAQGQVLWTARSTGQFLQDKSKYFKGSRSTDGRLEALFDFQGKDTEKAIVDEILEQGAGLVVPEKLPDQLLFGGGEYLEVPYSMPWTMNEGR